MSTPPIVLTDKQRDALTAELFAHWQATEPDKGHCFTGGDRELIEAVEHIRDEQDRERG